MCNFVVFTCDTCGHQWWVAILDADALEFLCPRCDGRYYVEDRA